MNTRRRSRTRNIAGVAAIALTMLVGAAIIDTVIAVVRFNRTWVELQKAADAAALAGSHYLPAEPATALRTARSYAGLNGVRPGEVKQVRLSADGDSLTIELTRPLPFYLVNLIAPIRDRRVSVAATAGERLSVARVAPIGIQMGFRFTPFETVTLHPGSPATAPAPGDWRPLVLGYIAGGDSAGSHYAGTLRSGYSSPVSRGDLVGSAPAEMLGTTRAALAYRVSTGLKSDPDGSAANHNAGDLREIVLPVMNFRRHDVGAPAAILGFARFWLGNLDADGDIRAEFIPGQPQSSLAHSDLVR